MEIPLATIERIMRRAGAQRIGEDAVEELQASTQEIAEEVARDAVTIVREDGRSQVERGDIRKAVEH